MTRWYVLAVIPMAVALPVPRARRGFVLAMCALAALPALITLGGWWFGRLEFARWVGQLPTMKPNTALAVLCIAAGLARIGLDAGGTAARVVAWLPLPAALLMGATLAQPLTGADFGIDHWLLPPGGWSEAGGARAARPAAAAALALLLLALAALPRPRVWQRARLACATAAFVVGYLASVGLLLEVPWGGGIGAAFATLSLPSAASIVMLAAAELSLLAWQSAPADSAGAPARAGERFLRGAGPVAMVLPAAVMWLQHIATARGWWGAGIGLAVAVAVLALALWALAVRSARWIDALEAELRASQNQLEQRVAERTAELSDSTARLRAGQTQLAAVVDSVSAAIITLDEQFRVVMFNNEAERVFGVAAGEMIGQSLDRLLPERSRVAHRRALQRFALTGETLRRMGGEAQLHGLRADGSEFPIAASISRVALPQGALLFTVVLRDLTEPLALEAERTARQAAELANRSKSQLLSHVSHELRTPLNAVLGFAQLLRDNLEALPGGGARLDFLGHIESASRQLDHLIADLLDLSRAEVGAIALTLRPVDAAEVLAKAHAMIASQARERGVEVTVADVAAPPMTADRKRLLQVMVNLLSNAVKYTTPGGRASATLREDGDEVVLDVVDTGDGMSDEQLAHLFEPFNRLGREQGLVPGSGIGLALSRQLVLAMGGRIEVASRPGQGSRFTVRLARAGVSTPADRSAR